MGGDATPDVIRPDPKVRPSVWKVAGAQAVVCLAALAVFAPLRHAEFVNYDDPGYVVDNAFVRAGFTREGVRWAFTHAELNWHPLTWLSHMLDCQLFGLDAGAHHAVNVLLHLGNAALLLAILVRSTGALGASAFVAGLFAVHPLHVESVAWVSERKDVLSTFFWFAALLGWVRYAERRTRARYVWVCVCLVLSLLSKGMAVSLPFQLLLLDFWPLRRWPARTGEPGSPGPSAWRALLVEKVPLFLLAAAGVAANLLAQGIMGAVAPLGDVPVGLRLANAAVSYAKYAVRMFWPVDLAVLYPLRLEAAPAAELVGSAAFLAAGSALALALGRRRRYLAVGWFWYLVTLLPVVGLVQIGQQAMADRYTYVPLVGLFVIVAWAGAEAGRASARLGRVLPAAAGLAMIACMALARQQVGYWQDSETLFRRALAVTRGNFVAENSLGLALDARGRSAEALGHFENALRINPGHAPAHLNFGTLLFRQGRLDEAEAAFREAQRLLPQLAAARISLGAVRLRRGDPGGAVQEYRRAVEMQPWNAQAHDGLAQALEQSGDLAGALIEYERTARMLPDVEPVRQRFAAALDAAGQRERAREEWSAVLRLNPANAGAHNNLGVLLVEEGRVVEAERLFAEAVRLQPTLVEARVNLALMRLRHGDAADAREHLAAALEAEPGNEAARAALDRIGGATP